MTFRTEINPGEIKIVFEKPISGVVSFREMGLKDEDLYFESGLLRMVFVFERIEENHFYQMPTIEINYTNQMSETHWQGDLNSETILDKYDHHGRSTVVLLNRRKMKKQLNRHVNEFILHAEFPEEAQLIAEASSAHFFN